MFQDTRPAALDDEGQQDWAPFRVDSGSEIGTLLRQLRDAGTPMVLSAPAGAAMVAELWSIDTEQRRVNFTADDNSPALRQLVDADEAVAVGYLDSIKLQFDLHGLLLVRGPRSVALQARLPSVVYRFQRRSAYRVRTLDRHAPMARLRHPAIPDMQLALRVIDVSIGGCALLLPDNVPPLPPGLEMGGVVLDLDTDTLLEVVLRIQHATSVQGKNTGMRLGCELVRPDNGVQRTLQRYIDQTQKRRRLLNLD